MQSVYAVWYPSYPEQTSGGTAGRRYRPSRLSGYADSDMDVDEAGWNGPVIPDYPSEPWHSDGPGSVPRIYFYDRHEPYFEFTNFSPHPVKFEGKIYPTAEHLFQAHKFLNEYPHLAERIRQLPTARDALEEAGHLQRFKRADWFDVNVGIMDTVLQAKFDQHRELCHMLLDTQGRDLMEASPVDSFWGTGPDGRGRNELGKALMRLRDNLISSAEGGYGYREERGSTNFPASHLLGRSNFRER